MSGCVTRARGGRVLLVVVFACLLVSGCRSYGGHGAEEAIFQQLQVAHQVFEEELVRAKADLSRLQAAASDTDVLAILAVQYAQIIRGHEAVLEEHADVIANLSAGSGYRDLRRTYGAIIAQQRTIRTQYEGVLGNVHRGYMPQDTTSQFKRPYSLIPPYYARVAKQQRDLSVRGLLAEVRSGRTPAAGFRIEMPDAGPVEPSSNAGNDSGEDGAGDAE